MARTLGLLRLIAVAFGVAMFAARAGWYGASGHLALPAVASGWGVVFGVICLRRGLDRGLARGLVVGEARSDRCGEVPPPRPP